MIPRTDSTWQTQSWQEQLKNLVCDPAELFSRLNLSPDNLAAVREACGDFPLRVSHSYLERIQPNNPDDPLLLQILPGAAELQSAPGYTRDPLLERDKNLNPGLIHKYRGRVLLLVSSACPVHCRYCFRRHFPYDDNRNSRLQWQQALHTIRSDPSISEVIYSGGDPLTASDRQLAWLTEQIAAIDHVKRLRIHTRFPVLIPARINRECLLWLSQSRLRVTMVLHVNHPAELDRHVADSLQRLQQSGITLLNQSVLLRGINDSVDTLTALSEQLFDHGVLPYYLHLLDKVAGAAHFDLPESTALSLYRALQSRLPGYLLPRLVREESGKTAKTLVTL